jgi:thiamine biosynthesis protein ThiC
LNLKSFAQVEPSYDHITSGIGAAMKGTEVYSKA